MLHANDLIALFVYSNLNTNQYGCKFETLGGLLITLATVSCITGNKTTPDVRIFEGLSRCRPVCSGGRRQGLVVTRSY